MEIKKVNKFRIVLAVLFGLHLLLVFTGNRHIYPTLQNTILKGRLGPEIDEYEVFENRIVKSENHEAWEEISDKKKLNQIEIDLHEKLKSVAFVVVRNNKVCFEEYWDGYNEDSRSNSFSMAKSFVSMAIGAALQDGSIKSVDQTISDFIPDFKGGENVTIRDLLVMSSGINFDENYINPFAYPARANYGNDLWNLTLGYTYTGEANREFKYLSGNTQLLSFVLKEATGKTVSEYFSEKIWSKIGTKNDALWSLDEEDGFEKAFCCFNSNALDFARLGKLYIDSGKYKGEQLVPAWYVSESIQESGIVESNGVPCIRYGYQWWLTKYEGKKVFYARGILGQYIVAIPEDNLIICRLGHKRIEPKGLNAPGELHAYINMAYRLSEGVES